MLAVLLFQYLLNLSNNELERLPPNAELFWRGTLKYLDISHNNLEEIDESVVKLCKLNFLLATQHYESRARNQNWSALCQYKVTGGISCHVSGVCYFSIANREHLQKGKKKSPGSATITSHSQSLAPGGRGKRHKPTSAKQTNAWKPHRPALSFPSEVTAMLNRTW